MRRLPRATFALLLSLLPATASVIGFLVLRQTPSLTEVLGVALLLGGGPASVWAPRAFDAYREFAARVAAKAS